jgi:hypothetical protein
MLSDFNGLSSLGIWTLEITDDSDLFSGNLTSVRVDICGTSTAGIYDNLTDASDLIVKTLGDNLFEISLTTEEYSENLLFEVYDIFGKKIVHHIIEKNNGSYTYPLDMSYTASGVYIIRMGNDSMGKVKRLIVE